MRVGFSLKPGWGCSMHKMQGMSFGWQKPIKYMRAHISNSISMESKFLGILYTCLSSVEEDGDWELCEPIDADRVLYVNTAKGMRSRQLEDERLLKESAKTIARCEVILARLACDPKATCVVGPMCIVRCVVDFARPFCDPNATGVLAYENAM